MVYGKKIRIGNYVVFKYKKGKVAFIKITDISGVFGFEVREDTEVFRMYNSLSMDSTDVEKRAIHSIIENAFASMTVIEAEYQHDLRVAVANLLNRIKHVEVDEVKDAEYIEEEKMVNDMLEKYDE